MRRAATRFLLLLALAALCASPAAARDEDGGPVTDTERDQAIRAGLRYAGGILWRQPKSEGTPSRQFNAAAWGVVQLLARDVLGRDTDADDGELDRVVVYLREYITLVEERTADEAMLPPGPAVAVGKVAIQYTWPLAVSAVFFAELHAHGLHRRDAKDAVQRIVRLLGEAKVEGAGWAHGRVRAPTAGEAPPLPQLPRLPPGAVVAGGNGYPSNLLVASALVTAGLGLARRELSPRGLEYLDTMPEHFREAQLSNGNFPYDPSQRTAHRDRTGAGRTAGVAFALWTLGITDDDPTLTKALAYVDAHLEDVAEGHGSSVLTLLLGALSAKARGTEAWDAFREAFFRRIVDGQDEDGRCECICEGKVFGSTNDSRPFGGSTRRIPAMRIAADARVTLLHTWILLFDRGTHRTFEKAPRGPAVTPSRRSPRTPR